MRKTDKKIDNSIRRALTEVCKLALVNVAGFKWLTHVVDHHLFPESLSIVCVFATKEELDKARDAHKDEYLGKLIQEKLLTIGIKLNNYQHQVSFDTEEDYPRNHDRSGISVYRKTC